MHTGVGSSSATVFSTSLGDIIFESGTKTYKNAQQSCRNRSGVLAPITTRRLAEEISARLDESIASKPGVLLWTSGLPDKMTPVQATSAGNGVTLLTRSPPLCQNILPANRSLSSAPCGTKLASLCLLSAGPDIGAVVAGVLCAVVLLGVLAALLFLNWRLVQEVCGRVIGGNSSFGCMLTENDSASTHSGKQIEHNIYISNVGAESSVLHRRYSIIEFIALTSGSFSSDSSSSKASDTSAATAAAASDADGVGDAESKSHEKFVDIADEDPPDRTSESKSGQAQHGETDEEARTPTPPPTPPPTPTRLS